MISRARRYFTEVTGLTGNMLLENVSPSIFEKRFHQSDILSENPSVQKWLKQMTYDQKGYMKFVLIGLEVV